MSPAIHALLARYRRKEMGEQRNPIVDEVLQKWRKEKETIMNPKSAPKHKHRIVTEDDKLWEAPEGRSHKGHHQPAGG